MRLTARCEPARKHERDSASTSACSCEAQALVLCVVALGVELVDAELAELFNPFACVSEPSGAAGRNCLHEVRCGVLCHLVLCIQVADSTPPLRVQYGGSGRLGLLVSKRIAQGARLRS